MIGLVIPIYNRPEYVKRCFDSLRKLTQRPDILIVVDDNSTADMFGTGVTHIGICEKGEFWEHKINTGVRQSLLDGIEKAFELGCTTVINLDSDAIVKPDFIEKLTLFHTENIVSGFNCNTPTNPSGQIFKADGISWTTKAFCNGINMCFNHQQYEKYIKPSLLKEGNWDYNTSLACQKDNLPFLVTVPSVVQHIGIQSSMGHTGGDFAQDFKMLSLPDVTLFGIDAHDPAGITRAAEISQRDIDFGNVKIITERLFSGREAYSRFILKDLAKYIETSHVLIIHADGYVINWEAWDNSWLQYDYIGATWWYKDNMNVGNGGFSLRSKRLQDILAAQNIPDEYLHPEDHCICRIYRESLERDFGIKFAPEEVANKFSIEAYNTPANRYVNSFGFHGVHVRGLPAGKEYVKPAEPRAQIGQVQTFNRPNQSRHIRQR